MKSIVEEASSLAKAFTQAWERAGKPQDCTIKVLAEPEKNFIGMTTKSAKIALFFNEPAPTQTKKSTSQPQPKRVTTQQPTQSTRRTQSERHPATRQQSERRQEQSVTEQRPTESRPNNHRQRQQRSVDQRNIEQRSEQHMNISQDSVSREVSSETSHKQEVSTTPRIRPTWTDEMGNGVQAWVKESLQIIGCSDTEFQTTMSRSILTITFSKPVLDDFEKERLLFRSWAHLIVQHIKQEFKVHGKELKIILKGSRGQ